MTSVQDAHKYYLKYDEEKRLQRDKAHTVEFATAIKTIEKYVTPDNCVIDVGCGTGRYSITLSPLCREMLATDLMENLIQQLQDKIKTQNLKNISCLCANALELAQHVHQKFDVILCMGPLYHLNTKEQRTECYNTLKKMAKQNTVFIFSYLTTNAPLSGVLKGKMSAETFFKKNKKSHFYQGAFFFTSPAFMSKEMAQNNMQILEHLALDPICNICADSINVLPDDKFLEFVDALQKNNTRPQLLKISSHNMIVAKTVSNAPHIKE